MPLFLSDIGNFTLAELDDFTLEELDNMSSYNELFAAVQEKYRLASKMNNDELPLTDTQIQAVVEIAQTYMKNQSTPTVKTITINVATQMIGSFLKWCALQTIDHLPEILAALNQAYLLLEQFVNQKI